MSTIREDFFTAKAKGSLWDVAVSIKRGNPLPLDADSIFESYTALEAYAADVLAYPGQVVAVVNEDSTGIYYLDQNLAIKPVGVIPAGDNLSVDMDDEDVISLHDFGKAFYKFDKETKKYNRVPVSNENPWVAGLEPKVVTEGGKLVLGWYEPNPTTIDGVNDQVSAVQGTVEDLVDSVGAPSTENSEATGLYKEVEDVQEDVEELIDAVGTKDDSLGNDVQTLWAHVNDHTGRLEALEEIDHDLYALAADLADETKRAEDAEKANAAAIKAIADDYLKAADKYDDTALANRVKTIEDDYLKAEDIANMATDAEVEAAVAAEAKARDDADKELQRQINLIMDNPDTQDVIDSIEEFKTYIDEHGEIAEGFRTDINANKDAIDAEKERAEGVEGGLNDRLIVLEAIDHDAYIAADAALKTELEGKINAKADASALTNAISTLEGEIDQLELVDEAFDERIGALEDKFGEGEGTVEEMIAAAKQAAIDAAATDATNKANAAKDAAIADADAKLANKANVADVYNKQEVDDAVAGATTAADNAMNALDEFKKAINTEVYGNETGAGDSRIDTAEAKLANIENGAQVNVIEAVVAKTGAKITAVTEGKTVTIDDTALQTLIGAARELAQAGVDAAAEADSKASNNALTIQDHGTRLNTVETLINGNEDEEINGLLKDVAVLKARDTAHAAEFDAVNKLAAQNSADIATLKTSKVDVATFNETAAQVSANKQAIETLNNTTIPGINGEIAKKADASALDNYYTKTEVGQIAEGKTLVQMIADAQAAATYDDTAVKGLIAAEAERAGKEEERLAGLISDNAADIVKINALLETVSNEDDITSLKELALWFDQHGKDAAAMAEAIGVNTQGIADNLAAINAIKDENTGILAEAKSYAEGLVKGIPVATASVLGLVKFDNDTVKMNADNQLYVAKVSTDILTQGEEVLVLNGGNA